MMLRYVSILLLACAAVCGADKGHAGEIDDILAAWESRAESCKTVGVDYEAEVTVAEGYYTFPHEQATVSFPPESSSFETAGILLLDCAGQRLRYHFEEQQPQLGIDGSVRWVPREWTTFLTSDYVKEYRPSERNGSGNAPGSRTTDLRIDQRPGMIPVLSLDMYPLLFAAGKYDIGFQWKRSPFETELKANDLKVERIASYQGSEHVVLQTKPFSGNTYFEYWVDRQNPLRVHRLAVYKLLDDGQLSTRADIDITYREESPGPVPDSWRATVYMIGNQVPKIVDVHRLSYEFDVAVQQSDFDLVPPQGTHVRDQTRPAGAQRYVVGETEHPELPPTEFQEQLAASSRFRTVLIGLGLVVLMCAVGVSLRIRNANRE